MSIKELSRADILLKVLQKALNQLQAADILGISSRQVRRLLKNYKNQGPIRLISKKQGQGGIRTHAAFAHEKI